MNFSELASSRRSVRKFLPDPVEKADLIEIISVAINAASAGNEQMWHFKIVTSETLKTQMVFDVPKESKDLKAVIEEGPWITKLLFKEERKVFKILNNNDL